MNLRSFIGLKFVVCACARARMVSIDRARRLTSASFRPRANSTLVAGDDFFSGKRADQALTEHGGSEIVRAFTYRTRVRPPHVGGLLEHMKGCHQRHLCLLCVDNRPLFLSEQEVFTVSGLRKHEARVEGGHPLCRFCSKR